MLKMGEFCKLLPGYSRCIDGKDTQNVKGAMFDRANALDSTIFRRCRNAAIARGNERYIAFAFCFAHFVAHFAVSDVVPCERAAVPACVCRVGFHENIAAHGRGHGRCRDAITCRETRCQNAAAKG